MYLPFFFKDDIIITFDKNLNETIIFKDMETEFNELSSGQKTRAELAVVFSLYMMVRALFGSGTNLLVFDEILDKNLDDDGVDSVVNILNNIAEESAIFVVSHKEEYKEKFPLSIKVKTDGNGFTKLEE
jgi:DNA repair exonuclease SbcCD ATPase subunit